MGLVGGKMSQSRGDEESRPPGVKMSPERARRGEEWCPCSSTNGESPTCKAFSCSAGKGLGPNKLPALN